MRPPCPAGRVALGLAVLAPALVATARPAAAQPPARPAGAPAASASVRGTVTDSASGRGVAGAQLTIVAGRVERRATTDEAGRYAVSGVPAGRIAIRVQRLGFAPPDRTLTVGAGATGGADFALRALATTLSEVVTIGYGTSSRRTVSSAIATVDSTAIANVPVASVDNALQGKLPGVQIMQNSGEPGAGISVRVRGPASLNAGNQPLYVVDGVPVIQESFDQLSQSGQAMTPISALNPDEIASIDVLKDAAAAAIYGSRGSNGVVLITTKRGAAGRTRFTVNAYGGTQRRERTIGLLDARQYVEVMNESAKNDGYDPEDYDFEPGVDDARSFDWQDAIFQRATVADAQLSLSGGSERTRFLAALGGFDQGGIIRGSRYQRQNARVNLDVTAGSRWTVLANVGLTREENRRVPGDQNLDGVLTNAVAMQPMRPVFGDFFGFGGDAEGLRYSNPRAVATYNSNRFRTQRALGNLEARLVAHDRVRLTGRAGADLYDLNELAWSSPKVDQTYAASIGGVGRTGNTLASRYVLEGFANVDVLRGERQTLALVAGSSAEWNRSTLDFLRGEGFPTGFTGYVRNAATITSWDGAPTENTLVSVFGRANWSWGDRYLASVSLRTDGSSRFGADNRYGLFPAVSLGWALTEESFAAPLRALGTLKLRGSYGVTGNQGIGDFASRSLASGTPYSGATGVAATQLGNPRLKWETTKELDVGLDYAIPGGRVSVIADWYDRRTSDLLVQRPIAAVSGYESIWDNVGAIRNRGVDLGLRTVNLAPRTAGGIGWTSDLNVTFNRNRVTALYADRPLFYTVSSRITSAVAVGQPLGEFYLYRFLRVDPQTGNAVFAKTGGGETQDAGEASRDFSGSPQPRYFGGLTNTLTWRGFDLRAFLQVSQGGKVFNMMRIFTDDGGWSYDNKSTHVLRRWRKPGDVTDVPRMSYDGTSGADVISSRFVEDGSFVRLQDVTLGWRLPPRLAGAARLSEARLFVSGRNLRTWTDYSGYNPDVNSGGATANVVMGVDYYAYPLPRTVTVGVSGGW